MSEYSLNIADYYNLCCRVLQPFINICNDSESLKICNETNWNDECDDTKHLTKWIIKDDVGKVIWRQDSFVNMEESVPIGTDSTGVALNLPNGVEDLISFIESIGICVCMGQMFQLCIIARNCYNSSKESNILTFTSCRNSNSITINGVPLLINGTPLVFNPSKTAKIKDCRYTNELGETYIIKRLQSHNTNLQTAIIILSNDERRAISYQDFENDFTNYESFINYLQECNCACKDEDILIRESDNSKIEEYDIEIAIGEQEKEIIPTKNYDAVIISHLSKLPIIVTIFHDGTQSKIKVGEENTKTFDWENSVIEKLRFGEINQDNTKGSVDLMTTQRAYYQHQLEITFFNSK